MLTNITLNCMKAVCALFWLLLPTTATTTSTTLLLPLSVVITQSQAHFNVQTWDNNVTNTYMRLSILVFVRKPIFLPLKLIIKETKWKQSQANLNMTAKKAVHDLEHQREKWIAVVVAAFFIRSSVKSTVADLTLFSAFLPLIFFPFLRYACELILCSRVRLTYLHTENGTH